MTITTNKLSTEGHQLAELLVCLIDLQQQKNYEKSLGCGKLQKTKELERSVKESFEQLDSTTQKAIHSLRADIDGKYWRTWLQKYCEAKDKHFFSQIHPAIFQNYQPGFNGYVGGNGNWTLVEIPTDALDWYRELKKAV